MIDFKDTYSIELIQDDFEGNLLDCRDCVGARALNRAIMKEHGKSIDEIIDGLPWNWSTDDGQIWIAPTRSIIYESKLLTTNDLIDMMYDAEPGDIVVFKKFYSDEV